MGTIKRRLIQAPAIVLQSWLAGFTIAIAGTVNLSVDNKIVGSLLFTFGLLFVVAEQMYLFTGKIGAINLKIDGWKLPIIIVGNWIGVASEVCLIKATRFSEAITTRSSGLSEIKLNDSPVSVFILAIFCGMLMYLAVHNASKGPLYIVVPVVVFILCGFEHSIANMFYFLMGNACSWKAVAYIVIMLAGNTVGSLVIKNFGSLTEKK